MVRPLLNVDIFILTNYRANCKKPLLIKVFVRGKRNINMSSAK